MFYSAYKMQNLVIRQLDFLFAIWDQAFLEISWGKRLNQQEQQKFLPLLVAPAGFWPRGQNLRRHPKVPRVYMYTYKRNIKKVLKKCVGSMEIFSIWWN